MTHGKHYAEHGGLERNAGRIEQKNREELRELITESRPGALYVNLEIKQEKNRQDNQRTGPTHCNRKWDTGPSQVSSLMHRPVHCLDLLVCSSLVLS